MKFSWSQIIVLLGCFLVVAVPSVLITPELQKENEDTVSPLYNKTTREYLNQSPEDIGVPFDRFGNTLVLSENGRYLAIEGFTEEGQKMTTYFAVIDLEKREVIHTNEGNVSEDSTDSYLVLKNTEARTTSLFDFETLTQHFLGNFVARHVSISPKGNYIGMTFNNGSRLLTFPGKEVVYESKQRHGFEAWLENRKEVFGFYATGNSLGDGAYEYIPAFFDISTKEWNTISPPDGKKTFKKARWLVQGELLWVTAGFDTGVFEYVFNVNNNQWSFITEASGIMGSLSYLPEQKQFIQITRDGYTLWSLDGEVMKNNTLKEVGYRDMVHVIENNKLLYRSTKPRDPTSKLQTLSLKDGSVATVATVKEIMGRFIMNSEQDIWILPTTNAIKSGVLQSSSNVTDGG